MASTPVQSLNIGKRVARPGGVSGRQDQGLRLTGDEELFKLLSKLPDRVAQRVLRGAPAAAAKLIRNEIRINARARFSRRSGDLVRAIKSRRASSEGDDLRAYVFIEHGSGAKYDAFYWHFLEFGTVNTPAKPFVRPALDSSEGKAHQAMGDYVRKRFDKEVAKMARSR